MQAIKQFFIKYFLQPGTERNWLILSSVLYFLTHLISLTSLPVFADEAIYIRWAQLIIDEPLRYAFFPLNDGKTPLFIWLLIPFQYIFSDQLFAGRFLAVLIGFLQMLLIGALVKKLGGSRTSQILSQLLVLFLPFWYFYHRMALMDGLLTLCISGALYATIVLQEEKFTKLADLFKRSSLLWIVVGALAVGAALWSKLPAVLAFPSLCLFVFLRPATQAKNLQQQLVALFYKVLPIGAVIFGGLCIFALLKLNPAFGQLFSRGGDFLYPVSEVLGGGWSKTLPQLPTYLSYFVSYLSAGVLFLLVFGCYLPHPKQRQVVVLTLAGLLFVAPIALLGKVVYARYLLPAAPFFTLAAVLTIDTLLEWLKETGVKKIQAQILLAITGVLIVLTIIPNLVASLVNPNTTPFVPSDRVQYLTEWSSGHGIIETVALLEDASQTKKIALATEGYFGTLPDAVLLYLHRRDVENIIVEGIGQPVQSIPDFFIERAAGYDEIWLVVNSHRMQIVLPQDKLKAEYCRPFAAPCLQVWDITEYLSSAPKTE